MFRAIQNQEKNDPERYKTFHFSSHDNPYISREALSEIYRDMTSLSFRMEILAQDIDEAPGALWTRKDIEDARVRQAPDLDRIVVAVDPSATSAGDDAGIVVAGKYNDEAYILADETLQGSPLTWAQATVAAYHKYQADRIIAEKNNGGEMVELVIRQVDPYVPITLVNASRSKQTRAEPVGSTI